MAAIAKALVTHSQFWVPGSRAWDATFLASARACGPPPTWSSGRPRQETMCTISAGAMLGLFGRW